MALHWIEGFEGFGATLGSAPLPTGIMGTKYGMTSESIVDIEAGRLSGYCAEFVPVSAALSPALPITHNTTIVGFAFKYLADYTVTFLELYTGVTLGVNLRWAANNELAVYCGTTLLGTSSGLSLLPNTWYYIEFKVVCADSGSFEVRVAGKTPWVVTGVDTKAHATDAFHNRFKLISPTIGWTPFFDDLYCLDGSGSYNNDFLGDMRVVVIRPNGDNAVTWERASGTANYECVDEEVRNADDSGNDYLYETVDASQDLYEYAALTGVKSGIRGIQINTDCRKTDTQNFNLIMLAKIGATVYPGVAQGISTTSYSVLSRIIEKNPGDADWWEVADIDGAQFGIELDVP